MGQGSMAKKSKSKKKSGGMFSGFFGGAKKSKEAGPIGSAQMSGA